MNRQFTARTIAGFLPLLLYSFISAKHVQALFKHLNRNLAPKGWGGYLLMQYQVIELVLKGDTGYDGAIMYS